MKTFLIKIPRDNTKSAAMFEQVFIQLHETLRGETVAFELLATSQNVGCCFSANETAAEVIASQVYAVAPDADIIEFPDYAKKLADSVRLAYSEISLVRSDIYPIKDYRDFEGDSTSGLLSVLSKCAPGEKIIVQITLRPEADNWFHNLRLNCYKWLDKYRHLFRVKYWFKKGVASTFGPKIAEKTQERLFRVNIRLAALSTSDNIEPQGKLLAVFGALSNLNTLDLNQIKLGKIKHRSQDFLAFSERRLKNGYLLSAKELSALYHLPNEREVPNLVLVLSKKAAAPTTLPTNQNDPEISFFGVTNFRNQKVPFGIKRSDRRRHVYLVGKSGTGKSKMLELLIRNDIYTDKGVGVLDPHGDLVDNVLRIIPKRRIKDVVLFDPSDLQYPPSFNPLEQVPEELKMRVTIGFIEIFKKLFGTNWSPRLEHVLRYSTLALLDTPNTTVLSILKMLTDKNYRQTIVRNIHDNVVKNFWVNEFAGWSEKFDNEAITPLLNKVGQFVATNMIRNIVGQPQNRIDFREIMDNRKILLMKVSKGILGEENASLLGAIAVTKIYQAAMSRADMLEEKRVDYYFYVDEFHNFATDTFDEILSEARKYHLNLTIANQFLGQLSNSIRKTVFGNVGSIVSFRVGGEDASLLSQEFSPRFAASDIINLAVREFIIKMSVDGEVQDSFSGRTLTMKTLENPFVQECLDYSRKHYSRPLAEVEQILQHWEEGKFNPQVDETNKKAVTIFPNEEVDFEEPLI